MIIVTLMRWGPLKSACPAGTMDLFWCLLPTGLLVTYANGMITSSVVLRCVLWFLAQCNNRARLFICFVLFLYPNLSPIPPVSVPNQHGLGFLPACIQ